MPVSKINQRHTDINRKKRREIIIDKLIKRCITLSKIKQNIIIFWLISQPYAHVIKHTFWYKLICWFVSLFSVSYLHLWFYFLPRVQVPKFSRWGIYSSFLFQFQSNCVHELLVKLNGPNICKLRYVHIHIVTCRECVWRTEY